MDAGFEVSAAARVWLATDGPAVIVQVGSVANLAVGRAPWGPAAAGLGIPESDVPPGSRVAIVGRGLGADHPARAAAERLRAQGHPTIVVECGWPRGGADVVTYGGSLAVSRALGAFLGVEPA